MIIRVLVKAGAKRKSVKEISTLVFEVAVKEKAEQNMANKAVKEALADFLSINPDALMIISGHKSPTKKIEIMGK